VAREKSHNGVDGKFLFFHPLLFNAYLLADPFNNENNSCHREIGRGHPQRNQFKIDIGWLHSPRTFGGDKRIGVQIQIGRKQILKVIIFCHNSVTVYTL